MELNYKTFGQGEPLIILHGLFGTLDNWQTLAKRFAEYYSVYIIDQRNHGKSPHTKAHTYALMAEDLRVFMEAHHIFKAHILGHSMGGKTAMQFALTYEDMVDKLIIADIAPKGVEGGHELIYEVLFSLDLDKLESRKDADAQLQQRIDDFGIRQFLLKNLTRKKEGGYAWKMNLPVLHEYYPQILSAITADYPFERETLFIRGAKSNYIQDEDIPMIKELFPTANLETVADAGHWIHAEQTEAFYNVVAQFLGQ